MSVHLFTQTDHTPVADHGAWAAALESMLRETGQMREDLDSLTFVLHDLIARETSTEPDETRGGKPCSRLKPWSLPVDTPLSLAS